MILAHVAIVFAAAPLNKALSYGILPVPIKVNVT